MAACLTIALAYRAAGSPDVGARSLGSFEAWSATVCAPLVWLGCADPVQGQEVLREDADDGSIAWHDALQGLGAHYGAEPFTAAAVAESCGSGPMQASRELFAALVRGGDAVNLTGAQLAVAFKRHRGRIAGGRLLVKSTEPRRNDGYLWIVKQVGCTGAGESDYVPSLTGYCGD